MEKLVINRCHCCCCGRRGFCPVGIDGSIVSITTLHRHVNVSTVWHSLCTLLRRAIENRTDFLLVKIGKYRVVLCVCVP